MITIESVSKTFSSLFYPLFIIGLIVWVAGFSFYNYYIINLPVDDSLKTDATIVLTGGTGRVEEGLHLLMQGSPGQLFISGVDVGVTVDDLITDSIKRKLSISKVELGYDAQNTRGNAQESIAWIKKHGYKSIRLITSNYHIPRSLLEFHEEMPDLKIYIHPVEPSFFNNLSRVTSLRKFFVLFREYNKLLSVIARVYFIKCRRLFS